MATDYSATRWSVYEANVQQYRILSATVQSFLLAVGSILYTQKEVPNFLLLLVSVMGILHIRFIWFEVVRARLLVIDYHKFQHYSNLSIKEVTELKDKYPENRYIHDRDARREVNSRFFKNPDLKVWRETRWKFDIVVPIGYACMWAALLAWKQPWRTPLW